MFSEFIFLCLSRRSNISVSDTNLFTTYVLFITNEPVKFATSGLSPIGCSDHSLIYVSRKLTCPRSIPRIIESRQYKNFVNDDFVNDKALVPWDIIEQIDNPIGAWEVWKQSFLAVANLHAPVKKRRVRNSNAPWLTPEIKRQSAIDVGKRQNKAYRNCHQ